ncbi:BF2992 family fimbrillin-A clan protein [Bacteroides sp.]
MKTVYKILFLFVLASISLMACEQDEVQDISGNGQIAIIPELSGMYVTTPGNWSSTRAGTHPDLDKITNLTEGSTLRLIATKSGVSTTKDYVIRTAGGGAQSLYPCTIDANGNIISEDKTPLYLSAGAYTFSAISPAHKYNNKITIGNGESVIATNNCWNQTKASEITITTGDKSKIIPLNPLMQLTSRMTFTLKGDETSGVSSIAVMQDGIEIDRIRQNAVTLNNVGDSIAAIITDNYNRIYIKEGDITIQEDGSLKGEICLLPIDNRPTPMTVILNLMVNGVPTQFTFSIVNKILYGGYSYDYKVTIKIKDNITVANWQETSWSTSVSGGGKVE